MHSGTFQIAIHRSDSGALTVQPGGPITLRTVFDFQQAIAEISAAPLESVILDLSRVTDMDSAGLGAIVIFAACREQSARFSVTGLTKRLKTLFEATEAHRILPCFDSLEAADLQTKKLPSIPAMAAPRTTQ
jgi:anti-anti-sigma factor